MTKSKEQLFHEATAKDKSDVWHCHTDSIFACTCGQVFTTYLGVCVHIAESSPTYSHSDEILRRMKEFLRIQKYNKFLWSLGLLCSGSTQLEAINNFINKFIFNREALLDKCLKFLERDN